MVFDLSNTSLLYTLLYVWRNPITVFFFCVVVDDLIDVESLQFDLAMVEAATEGFSDENKIGQGGFGVVYKVWNMFMQMLSDRYFFLC